VLDIYLDMIASQKRAVDSYRKRLAKRGLTRFEVLGRDADRELIRALAKQLGDDDADAPRLREAVRVVMGGEPPQKGGILAALRRSPLVGAELDVRREHEEGREIDL
jgi:outer membrane protein TolC